MEQQVAAAFIGDIGITSPLFPADNCTPTQVACAGATNGGSPEITQELFDQVVFYNRTLAVPARRDLDEPGVVAGAALFDEPDVRRVISRATRPVHRTSKRWPTR